MDALKVHSIQFQLTDTVFQGTFFAHLFLVTIKSPDKYPRQEMHLKLNMRMLAVTSYLIKDETIQTTDKTPPCTFPSIIQLSSTNLKPRWWCW